ILQVVPLATTAAAALLLAEPVGRRRWTAIAAGFAGVLVIVRPGLAGFDGYALIALTAMLFLTFRDLVTRRLPPALPSSLVVAVASPAIVAAGLGLWVGESWVAPDGMALTALALAAVVLVAANFPMIM